MKIKKIMCCCGVGLGSSMLVKLNVEKVLRDWGYKDVEVEHTTVSNAVAGAADLFVFGTDLAQFAKNLDNVVFLHNIVDINELKEKMQPYFPDAQDQEN